MNGIMYVRPGNGFRPNFPLTEKVDVNGARQHPLYVYLKEFCPPIDQFFRMFTEAEPLAINDVHWNFEKFLLGRDGRIVSRYHPKVLPTEIRSDIERELNKSPPTNVATPSGVIIG